MDLRHLAPILLVALNLPGYLVGQAVRRDTTHLSAGWVVHEGAASPTLPVVVRFYTSEPSNVLDTGAVREAVWAAAVAVGLVPELSIISLGWPTLPQPHVRLEVDVYAGGEVRFERSYVGADGTPEFSCRGETKAGVGTSTLATTLWLSHRMRTVFECVGAYTLAR